MEEIVKPEVGMGVTFGYGCDCYPGTIHKVAENGKTLWMSDDESKWIPKEGTNPASEIGEYEYTNHHANNEARWRKYTLRKNGRWLPEGASLNSGGSLAIGHRRFYQDPSF